MSNSIDRFLAARDFLVAHGEDYATAYDQFRWPELVHFNWALDYFDKMARGNDRTALWVVEEGGDETRHSFADMSARSNQVANFLRHQGVNRGDRILMMLDNVVPLWETMLAATKLGAVVIPATTLLSRVDLLDRIDRGNVAYVLCAADLANQFDEVPGDYGRISVQGEVNGWQCFEQAGEYSASFEPDAETLATDPLLLYFTSGTTAKPKLVEHSHQSYPVGHLSTMYWIGLRPGDVHLNIGSPGWAKHAWSNFFAPWNAGATVFVYNYERFDADAMLRTIGRCGVTTLCAPPTVWRMMIQKDLGAYPVKLREVIGAGEPLNPEIIEQVQKAWGLTLRDGYGQTETTAQIGNTPGQPLKLGSMGRPLPGYKVALLDADDNLADEGEISINLSVWPLGLMLGYKNDPAKTANIMRNGYYHTGDIASVDEEGYFTYIGRADDVFKASDYRISPFELESVLIEHEAVAEAAVVPSPDPVRLAVPKAFVVVTEGNEPDEELAASILKHCSEHLAPFKRIRRIEFSDLPKTISGKIRRVALRKSEQDRDLNQRNDNEYWEQDLAGLK